jgi:hypothetical protein
LVLLGCQPVPEWQVRVLHQKDQCPLQVLLEPQQVRELHRKDQRPSQVLLEQRCPLERRRLSQTALI